MKKLLISLVFLFLLNNTAWAIDQSEFQSPIDQDYYESIWGVNAICGPTSAAEMIDFWGHHGYPALGTDEEGILWDMIYEYIYRTSSGATYPSSWVSGVQTYFDEYGVDVEIELTPKGGASWSEFKSEIDAGRPVAICSYLMNHWMIAIDYHDTGSLTTSTITVLYGHIPLVRTYTIPTFGPSTMYCVYVRPQGIAEPPPDPSGEDWYEACINWCILHNWELEPVD